MPKPKDKKKNTSTAADYVADLDANGMTKTWDPAKHSTASMEMVNLQQAANFIWRL